MNRCPSSNSRRRLLLARGNLDALSSRRQDRPPRKRSSNYVPRWPLSGSRPNRGGNRDSSQSRGQSRRRVHHRGRRCRQDFYQQVRKHFSQYRCSLPEPNFYRLDTARITSFEISHTAGHRREARDNHRSDREQRSLGPGWANSCSDRWSGLPS
jgi:hypothetical protein